MIEFEHLYKSYNGQLILNNVSGRIELGKTVAILGSSGSGKSTLLRCLNLMDIPDSGKLSFNHREINFTKDNLTVLRQQVGMVFQNFNLFNHLSVLENLTYAPLKTKGCSKNDIIDKANSLLSKVGLIDKAYVFPSHLSGGQKQRIAIIRALMMEPNILLFDEPTSALDPEMVDEVLQVVQDLTQRNLGIVIVTHEMQFAKKVSDEVWFLHNGKIIEKSDTPTFFLNPSTDNAKAFLKNLKRRFYEL